MPLVNLPKPTPGSNTDNQPVTAYPDNAFFVVPDDDNHYDPPFHLEAFADGNVAVVPAGGEHDDPSLVIPMLAGQVLRFRVIKVRATGTTVPANGLLGIY